MACEPVPGPLLTDYLVRFYDVVFAKPGVQLRIHEHARQQCVHAHTNSEEVCLRIKPDDINQIVLEFGRTT